MVRYTDRPAMTIAVDLGRKARKQTKAATKHFSGRQINFCFDWQFFSQFLQLSAVTDEQSQNKKRKREE